MPAHDGLGLDEDQDVTPAGPDAAQDGPEEPVETVYGRPWSFPLQDRDLLPEGEDLEAPRDCGGTRVLQPGLRR
jgi:hypothetical protein